MPKKMIKPDSDIVLAVHKVQYELKGVIPCKHVYGHQGTRKKREAAAEAKNEGLQIKYEAEVAH